MNNLYNNTYSECVSTFRKAPTYSKIDKEILSISRKYYPNGGNFIEIGTNRGELISKAVNYYSIRGFDINKNAIRNPIIPELKSKLEYSDVCNGLPLPDDYADIVATSHVLEHIKNIDSAMKEIGRILKPGGISLNVMPFEPPIVRGINTIPVVIKALETREKLKVWNWFKRSRELHVWSARKKRDFFEDEISFNKLAELADLEIIEEESGIKFMYYPAYFLALRKPVQYKS